MARRRQIIGRKGNLPTAGATVETYGESIPVPREARSQQGQLEKPEQHGKQKDVKVPLKDKLR